MFVRRSRTPNASSPFNVAQQFINVLLAESTLSFAQQDLDSFQKTVDISETRFHAGDMSEGDLLKIKLQLLQFQSDVSAAKLARVQALAGLRQFLGFASVADDYDVSGDLDYQPLESALPDLKTMASQSRPDLIAAQQGVMAARSQLALAEVNGKQDLTAGMNYTHTAGVSSAAFTFNIPLAVFDRNQGEIARTRYAITQAQEQPSETAQQVSTDVVDAYENLRTNDQIIQLYQRRLCGSGQAVARHQRIRLSQRRRQPSRLPRFGTYLPGQPASLSPGFSQLHARARTAARAVGTRNVQ